MIIRFDDPVQQEIRATIRALSDAWTKGKPDDLANYFHRNRVAITSTDRLRRESGADCIVGWKGFADAARIHRWQETDPVIYVYGDAAVVAYYFDISFDMNGETFNSDGRDMFFMVKEEGRWWAVADQFSSFPG